jgi:hypothetical protein
LKAGAIPSGWVLLDFDDPLGMPADMRALDYRQRLERLETIMPGISTCERIVARSSSARVRRIGEEPGLPTHAYIQLSDRRKVDIVREHLRIRSALDDDLHFWRDTAGRKADGSPVRIECGLIDFGTFGAGRIVFTAAPQLDPSAVAAGYVVHDAGVAIENEGVGPLDVTDIELPDSETLRERSARGGAHTSYNRERGGISTVERGLLTFYTPVTSRGRTRRLSEWLADMRVDQKLRCEASFRPGSVSEAAYIRKTDFFKAFLHDTGTHTSYLLPVGYEPPQPGGVAIDSLAKAHRARLLLDQGNITGARSVLECAAERGSGLALFLLAESYDPSILSAWGIFSVWGIFGRRGGRRGNVTKARKLYAKAVAAGVYEAQHRLIAPH